MPTTPTLSLPLTTKWKSEDEYVQSLLSFITESNLFRNLCGGVHILDFLTRKPDLYTWVLPLEWREWFEDVPIDNILDLLLRENLEYLNVLGAEPTDPGWRGDSRPPRSLISYIDTIRSHSLDRSFTPTSDDLESLPRHIAVGMKPKKIHEVINFAAFTDKLCQSVSSNEEVKSGMSSGSSTIVDFGSGQNYLGRTLACPPYNRHVVAIEQRHHNVEGARGMDVHAKLTKKEKVMRNKKEWKKQLADVQSQSTSLHGGIQTPSPEVDLPVGGSGEATPTTEQPPKETIATPEESEMRTVSSKGLITYVEHELQDGHLENILYPATPDNEDSEDRPESIVVSIHSCGNLTHHGLRSLTLNPSVKAVAMIGCCYNLLTERLGPATYKLPQLRPNHPRLEETGSTFDPHGFPMSKRLELFEYAGSDDCSYDKEHFSLPNVQPSISTSNPTDEPTATSQQDPSRGVRLNITARMMAVQAPQNWTSVESGLFFTRHFYRALLQRILLDYGVVKNATSPNTIQVVGGSLSGKDEVGTPLIIGSLRKPCFDSFSAYVKGALNKLISGTDANPRANSSLDERTRIAELTAPLRDPVTGPEIVQRYETEYQKDKKKLSVIWSLMAFSASVVESTIVVDRWLWLKEQDNVERAWVEAVFGYELSPRNMCVVGVKKGQALEKQTRFS